MGTLKIFFHDSCFDGAASAAVFADFYRARIDASATVVLQGVQHQAGDPFAGHVLDADDNACVDFRYSPSERMTWWFDHHASAFQPPELRQHFEAHRNGQRFYDPSSRSNTKFEVACLRDEFGYELPASFDELVHWADIIDGAQFESAAAAVELADPALQIMTWLESNTDAARTRELIECIGRRPLAEIAGEPWVREPLAILLESHRRNVELIRARSTVGDGVVYFDLIDDGVTSFNKFISYYLFPDARYTVGLIRSPGRVKISVGSNPWSTATRTHHIAQICERYGGGGHAVVGAVSLPPAEVARGREIASEICAVLRSTP